jgi:hypothetical protein
MCHCWCCHQQLFDVGYKKFVSLSGVEGIVHNAFDSAQADKDSDVSLYS